MKLTEKTVATQVVYEGIIVNVHMDQAELENGKLARREVVEHPGGVAILPLSEDGMVTVVRQFRYPFGRVITELPAGKLERGEDPRLCALRELEEEVGIKPDELLSLGRLYTSPGFCTEVLHLYLARGLHRGACHPDEDEFLEICQMSLDELAEQAVSGELEDAKTVAAVLKAQHYLRKS